MKHWKLIALSGFLAVSLLFSACSGGTPSTTQTTNAPVVIPPRPAEFKVTGLVAPATPVEAGTKAPVTVAVANTGEVSGSYAVVLKIDGQDFATQQVTLAGGESKSVSFDVSRPKQGTYKLTAGESTADFKVTPIPISEATLHQNDLPAGFTQFSVADLVDFSSIAQGFGANAQVNGVFSFANTTSTNVFGMVFGFNIYPLTSIEQIQADTGLIVASTSTDSFVEGLGLSGVGASNFQILSQFSNIGDKSLGVSFVFPESGVNLTVEIVMFRNSDTVTVFYVMGFEGLATGVTTSTLVNLLQSRIDAAEASR